MRLAIVPVLLLVVGGAATRSALAACVGDCDGGGSVAIDDLVSGVNLARASATREACLAFDPDGDGTISVGELRQAIAMAF